MPKYNPPEQSKFMQFVDIVALVGVIFISLMLPIWLGWAAPGKVIEKIENPTWELLQQTPAQVEQWVKLGYADAAAAHDVIQSKWDYSINWMQLVLLTAALIGYFVFLFRASDQEYRDVIDEKFNGKQEQ
jgi:hypothetical protein